MAVLREPFGSGVNLLKSGRISFVPNINIKSETVATKAQA
jgi:hypothetical protein